MANYAHTKEIIAQNIYTNHEGKVTAESVKTAANEIVKALIDGGYLYAGVAKLTPTQTNPGSPDANVFYIATEPGTYTNFVGAGGSLVVADGEVAIFKWNGTWSKEVTGVATAAQVTELGQKVTNLAHILGYDFTDKGSELTFPNAGVVKGSEIVNQSSPQYKHTDPVEVKSGDVIYFKSNKNLSGSYNALTLTNAAGTTLLRLLGFSENWNEFLYVVKEDSYVIFNSRTDDNVTIVNILPAGIILSLNNLEIELGKLEPGGILDYATISWATGTQELDGTISHTTNYIYKYSSPISVKAGTLVSVNSFSVIGPTRAAIIKTTSAGEVISAIEMYNDDRFHWAVIESDCYIVINVRNGNDALTELSDVYVNSTLYNESLKDYINKELAATLAKFDYVDLTGNVVFTSGSRRYFQGYHGYRVGRESVTATIIEDASRKCSNPIEVKRGDILLYFASEGIGSRPLISYMGTAEYEDFNKTVYSCILESTSENSIKAYRYVVKNDGYVVVDCMNSCIFKHFRLNTTDSASLACDYRNSLQNEQDVLPKLLAINNPTRSGRVTNTAPVALLHFSDIHGDITALQRICNFREKYAKYLDDTILSGDICGMKYAVYDDLSLLPGYLDILKAIGNHDVYDANGDAEEHGASYDDPAYWATPQQKYTRYMDGIQDWGVVQPTDAALNGYCYYYKDYTARNLRVIVVDCMAFDATQLAWFVATLESARLAELDVMVVSHFYPITGTADESGLDTAFDSLFDGMASNYASNLPGATDAVDTFINAGGTFVCWLCGHLHYDKLGYITSHPNQLYICIGAATKDMGWQDTPRMLETGTEDLFNIIGIDTYSKCVRIMRVGTSRDWFMREKDCVCVNYATKTIIK